MQPTSDFLTPDECAEVDKALLTSHDKFTVRVALYALRSLKLVAQQNDTAIADLQPEQVEDWVYQDETLQQGLDREFRLFFSQLVISSLNPLKQISRETRIAIADLSVPQVVAWFEQHAKQKLER